MASIATKMNRLRSLRSSSVTPAICELCGKPKFKMTQIKFASTAHDSLNVFDRNAKRLQRNRAASAENYKVYDYLKDEIGWRMADRLCDIKRKFDVAVDLGAGRGYISPHITQDTIGKLYQCELAEKLLEQSNKSPEVPTENIVGDEEKLPFEPDTVNLVVSSLALHWVNDLPSCFKQVFYALKLDGCFMGALFGGDTLFELRVSLQLAETERQGGFAPHISPFTTVQDLGGLLSRAGFTMLTIDIDTVVIDYPSMFELMQDLKGMGENNCSWSRRLRIPRDTLMAASAIYKEMHGHKDKPGIPATFDIIYFIGWKPHPDHQKPAKRGSGQVSLKDLDKLDEMSKMMKEKGQGQGNVDQLSADIDRLRKSLEESAARDFDNEKK